MCTYILQCLESLFYHPNFNKVHFPFKFSGPKVVSVLNIGWIVMKQKQMYVCTLKEFISNRCNLNAVQV